MKLKVGLLIIILFFSNKITFGICETASDSIAGSVTFALLKVNPAQIIFSEIPVSFELFLPHDRSIQFQVGYIFSLGQQFPVEQIFENAGPQGEATNKGLFSYRTSPYNNRGASVKFEFRKYKNSVYQGIQVMYKNCFYRNSVFEIFDGTISRKQTENKFSNIIGIGYVIGRQSEDSDITIDWYAAVGLRMRLMSVKVLEVVDAPYASFNIPTFPNTRLNFANFYPFLNLGIRIGFRLQKTVWV